MPHIIIRPRTGGGGGSRSTADVVENQDTLVILTPGQVEIYTDEDATKKLQALAGES